MQASAGLDFLLHAQNSDGGWPYYPGSLVARASARQSWVEPAVYALLAIQGEQGNANASRRASQYLLALQNPDGSWPASAQVPGSHWVTSLCLSAGIRYGWPKPALQKAANWLLAQYGAENRFLARLGHMLDPDAVEYDPRWQGWAWTPGTSSWVEPTSHAIIALSHAREFGPAPDIDERIESAKRLLLDRRCADGGWNYGNRRVRGADLPGYPQTTALALLALRNSPPERLENSLARAGTMFRDSEHSRLARAWLALALRAHGKQVEYHVSAIEADIPTAALEFLLIKGKEPA